MRQLSNELSIASKFSDNNISIFSLIQRDIFVNSYQKAKLNLNTVPMLQANIIKVSELISQLISMIPVENLLEAVIFGSSAIILHEIDLERSINDLDIFVSENDYARLKRLKNITEFEKTSNQTGIKIFALKVAGIEDIEILKAFPGVNYLDVLAKATLKNGSNNLKVASIEDLMSWKTVQGRPKDHSDLEKMQKILKLPTNFL